jgi:hypothetical protein
MDHYLELLNRFYKIGLFASYRQNHGRQQDEKHFGDFFHFSALAKEISFFGASLSLRHTFMTVASLTHFGTLYAVCLVEVVNCSNFFAV